MALSIQFNEEKNQLLQITRGVAFEDIIEAIASGDLLADIRNPSFKRGHQRIFVVQIDLYAYAVPYVINIQKQVIFLKTAYPSRALTRKYIKGGKDDTK